MRSSSKSPSRRLGPIESGLVPNNLRDGCGCAKVQMQVYDAAFASTVKKLAAGIRPRPVPAAGALHFGPRHCIAAAGAAAHGHSVSTRRHFGNRPCSDE